MCKSKWFKRYSVELYDDNDIEIKTYVFEKNLNKWRSIIVC